MKSSSRSAVDPFIVMDVMQKAAEAEAAGRDIIHMEVGQPGTPAPAAARALLQKRLEEDPLGYTVALGLPELRRGIADLYRRWYGIELRPSRIIVTAGSSAAFQLAFLAAFDAGDRVAIGDPGYPSYRNILRALNLEVSAITTGAAARYQPSVADVAALEDVAGLLVASPANPTGTMLGHDQLKSLIEISRQKGITFISDEIYHGLHYEQRAVSALEISDDVIVINSFSKYFSMTGWRIGWMVVPEDMVRTIERLAQNFFICAPHASQIAALGALDAIDELEANRSIYAANRALMLEGLKAAGFRDLAPPDGAFYIYADVSDFTGDSVAFAEEVLEKAGVSITPGMDFDPIRGHEWVRFSYARTTAEIEEGLRRLKDFMAER